MTDSPPPLFTLTGNLLAERTLTFPAWSAGRTQRATAETFQVGGKGINVAKMLTRLGAPNTALGFTGGATGEDCLAWLRRSGLAFRTFPSTTPTRTGTVIRASGQPETTFLGPDAAPDAAALRACADFLDAQPAGLTLAGGQFAVIVRNRAAFTARYGTAATILGEYPADSLSNSGETLTLLDVTGAVIQSFTYRAPNNPPSFRLPPIH